ncbi:TadE/TadG family type IV pilus assembly protein [Hyalangium gracile]|uniref:TadE/TadG family type IV pilus assembly protein n=1 Tax=Hyalangium gracile TaxID=394092 RepID=UPI001CCD50D7|nr:pilus assembly protein [Hyalangium gracile]
MKTSFPVRRARGQAMVETALGVTVLVSIIAFGIYLSEVGFLSLKVQEAAVSALWDGTAGDMHIIPISYSQAGDSMDDAADNAEARYADFNGLSSVNVGGNITQVFTRGQNLTVDCDMGDGPEFRSSFPLLTLIYRDNEGTTCTAGADISAFGFPRSFLDNGSGALYQQRHLENSGANLRVCAAGRAVGGVCQGGYSMLVDDWGLAGRLESLPCNMLGQDMANIPCPNLPFYAAVRGAYEPSALLIPMSSYYMAEAVLAMPPPINEQQFWMSAANEETNFIQFPRIMGLKGNEMWTTSPGSLIGIDTFPYGISYVTRRANGNCFLGKDCD